MDRTEDPAPTVPGSPSARELGSAEDFSGSDRYHVRRRIGAGAYGVVYEAIDRTHRERVALKVLRGGEADALYRFKRGFRALADLRHPNLAELYELHHEGGRWFFTMELVDGRDVVTALRGDEPQFPATWMSSDDGGEPPDLDPSAVLDLPLVSGATPDWSELRAVFVQLARGLQALHGHGRLHRDIKPSNVLVTDEGRLALLDFGLIAELEPGGGLDSGVGFHLVGTPAYMSPEQARGEPVGPAADWYAAGVVLFQAIAGRLPIEGAPLEVLSRKQHPLELDLRDLAPGVPEDLAALAEALLQPDPANRPDGDRVLGVLGDRPTDRRRRRAASGAFDGAFVGRREPLAALDRALTASRRSAVSVFVHGRSGIGKSALIQRFGDLAAGSAARTMVLHGRCHLQESVPYKALDPLVDSLSRQLNRWSGERIEEVLPRPEDLRALTRLFPVLLRIPQVAARRATADPERDPRIVRRRAARALRHLLTGIGLRTPLMLLIDDLQWGDLDSLEILDEVLRPPASPRLLLVAAVRTEDEAQSPFLQALGERRGDGGWMDGPVQRIRLEGLGDEEARELVRAHDLDPERQSFERVLQDAGGSPLLIAEMARWVRSRDSGVLDLLGGGGSERPAEDDAPVRLLLRARLEELGPSARRLLEAVAVAGQPIDVGVARQAASVTAGGTAALVELRDGRWIRERLLEGRRQVETYHDRVRETVAAGLAETERVDLHRQLAVALEAWGAADPETLAIHYRAIGEDRRAAEYAEEAAEQAQRALAFDRAARLWRLVLALDAGDDEERHRRQVRLGDALAHAGRSREAADAWLEAVGRSGRVDPIEIQRDAAEKLLVSGHIDRGLAVLRHVLRTVGMQLHASPTRTLLDLWWQRLRLRWTGLRIPEEAEATTDLLELRRVDICWSVEIGLCLVDVLHAAQFHARHLRLALAAGDPKRVARGLAMELFFGPMDGSDVGPALRFGERLAREHGCEHAAALSLMARGMRACSLGRWQDASERLESGREALLATGRGISWELDTIQHFRIVALRMQGRWAALFSELPDLLKEARDRGDLYLEIHLRSWGESLRSLVDDRPEAAAGAARRNHGRWSYQGFHYQHFGHLHASAEIRLYRGEGLLAWEAIREAWPALTSSMIQRIEMVLVQSLDLRGRCALAAAQELLEAGGRPGRTLAVAGRCARRLRRQGSAWARAHGALLEAGRAALEQREAAKAAALSEAEVAFLETGMELHAAVVARLRRPGGGAAPSRGDLLDEIGAVAPEKVVAMLAPGIAARPAS